MKRRWYAGLSLLLVAFLLGPVALPARAQRGGPRGGTDPVATANRLREAGANNWQAGVAWWTNTALVQRLGLTDEQKSKIERAFENHRQSIVSSTALLEKEEAQLARLLGAEPLERNAVLTQIDRVVQARGEVERANAAMTLEMREQLTHAQWAQLQTPARTRVGPGVTAANLISQTAPVYPEPARQARIQGIVVLEIEISKEGSVENMRVMTGHPLLIQAALDAVKQWRYKPILLNGEPMPVVTTVTVNFPFPEGTGQRGAPPTPPPPGAGGRRGPQ